MEQIEPNNVRGAIDWSFDFTAEIARLLAFPVLVWTTKSGTWGTRFLAGSAAAGLSWLGVIGIACVRSLRNDDLFYFWIATAALLIFHRVVGIVRRLGGYECAAEFPGASWLWLGPGPWAERAARFADAVVAFGVGLVLFQLGRAPLGAVLMIGAAARLFGEGLDVRAVRARA
ncbi:hypothetical protein VT84_07575 [Gemmata sp. SH-PL17]|uniref:hypothetical protein n=1 Tax=Gemmata sp. SH-PL17 TaxID=1630693 RepID=UPI00078D3021|nr:hypothetical protein [Gemmata sp. SH-PL17]AMV24240.1 hypothetical protein VT84_07575 [Gemmata sp. SH-PL17]